jgi:PKD repeat protein
VNFTDLSTGAVGTWDWSFGDGSHSALRNPSHTYAAGTYNVTLTITGQGGSNTTIKQNYIVAGVGAILEGHVNLQGRLAPPDASWITGLTVNFWQGGGVVRTETLTTDNSGDFTIPNVAAGTYDICVKSPRALSELKAGVVMVSGTTTPASFDTLREGDASNDDAISLADYALLYAAYGSEPGDGNWNDNCDFNRNGAVDLGDYALLYSNYGQAGDCYAP